MGKKTVLLDFNGTSALLTSGLIYTAAEHFNLLITEETKAVLLHYGIGLRLGQKLESFYEKGKITPVKSGTALMDKLEGIQVSRELYSEIVPESMLAYYNKHKDKIDYVLIDKCYVFGTDSLSSKIRGKGGIVVSSYGIALILYHEGELAKHELSKLVMDHGVSFSAN